MFHKEHCQPDFFPERFKCNILSLRGILNVKKFLKMKKKCTVRFYSNLKGQMIPANTAV